MCPLRFDIKQSATYHAIYCENNHGPSFGFEDIEISHHVGRFNRICTTSKATYDYGNFILSLSGGSTKEFELIEYQVFQIL